MAKALKANHSFGAQDEKGFYSPSAEDPLYQRERGAPPAGGGVVHSEK